jgi:hypothetical protein
VRKLSCDLVMDKRTVGILGGGQLGRMMIESAHKLGWYLDCIKSATHSLTRYYSIQYNIILNGIINGQEYALQCLIHWDLHLQPVSYLIYA